jgi:hypothetical protein
LDLPVCVLEKSAPLEVSKFRDEVMKQLLLDYENGPIGLGAYFAYQVGIFASIIWCICEAIGSLLWSLCFYFVVFFSFYAFIAEGQMG